MSERSHLAELEALLFAAGDPLDLESIAEILDLDKEVCADLLQSLGEHLDADAHSGLCLRRLENRYVLSIKASCKETTARFFRPGHMPALSSASYETLAAVLYNQPVTRAQVEAVRGVNSDGIMSRLEERGLIESCGVLEQPGRPALFRVSEKFLLETGLRSSEDLPPLDLLMYDSIRKWEEREE